MATFDCRMPRRRRQHATDRNFAVRGVDMQLVADPGFLKSFGVMFGAHIAGPGQIEASIAANVMPRWRSIRLDNGADQISPLRGQPRLRLSFGCGAGLSDSAGFSRASIAVAVTRDVSDQTIRVRVLDQRLVQSRGQSAGGEFGESPRKRRLAGHFAPALPASHEPTANVLSTDNISIGSRVVDKLNTAFATKRPRQCRTFRQQAPREARPAGQERLDPGHTKNADQLLVSVRSTGHRSCR